MSKGISRSTKSTTIKFSVQGLGVFATILLRRQPVGAAAGAFAHKEEPKPSRRYALSLIRQPTQQQQESEAQVFDDDEFDDDLVFNNIEEENDLFLSLTLSYIEDVCSDERLANDRAACELACAPARDCCHPFDNHKSNNDSSGDNGRNSTCFETHLSGCFSYAKCHALDGFLDPAHRDLDRICNKAALEINRDECMRACESLSCCFTAEESCVAQHFQACLDYAPCQNLKEDSIDVAPTDLDERCKDQGPTCKRDCQEALCCSDPRSSCYRYNFVACLSYTSCTGNSDTSISVAPVHSRVQNPVLTIFDEICSARGIATYGPERCFEVCAGSQCCWEQGASSCFGEDPLGCLEYQKCTILQMPEYSDWTYPPIPNPTQHPTLSPTISSPPTISPSPTIMPSSSPSDEADVCRVFSTFPDGAPNATKDERMASCKACIENGCAWVIMITGVIGSCYVDCSKMDGPCYSLMTATFPEDDSNEVSTASSLQVCEALEDNIENIRICFEATDCSSCLETFQMDGTTPCKWYPYSPICRSGGCDLAGCGDDVCYGDPPVIDDSFECTGLADVDPANITCSMCIEQDCAWFGSGACYNSCDALLDAPCYSSATTTDENDGSMTTAQICSTFETNQQNDQICSAADDCQGCIATLLESDDEEKSCQWYPIASSCGRGGCGLIGCGESYCDNVVGASNVSESSPGFPGFGDDSFLGICGNITDCIPCLDNAPICRWSAEQKSCSYNQMVMEDMPGPESCTSENGEDPDDVFTSEPGANSTPTQASSSTRRTTGLTQVGYSCFYIELLLWVLL